jgi:hypothetical protein
VSTDAVTRAKSAGVTPFAVKRGAQWAIADATLSSIPVPFPRWAGVTLSA